MDGDDGWARFVLGNLFLLISVSKKSSAVSEKGGSMLEAIQAEGPFVLRRREPFIISFFNNHHDTQEMPTAGLWYLFPFYKIRDC